MSLRILAFAITLSVLLSSTPAAACGGCFSRPQQNTVSAVTAHRMVFSISPERTVLWDQFQYSGSPEEFAWVLPVARGAYVEEGEQAFFDALDAATNTLVTSPPLSCAPSSGFGCSSRADSKSISRSSVDEPPTVRIVDQRTVGPYEVVTLRSTEGGELFDWLDTNGYFVPDEIAPTIDDYVSEGWDFVAVKLRPGQGVQQMTPVRVVTPGGKGVLPLRMVAAGVGDEVDILLYVIGDGRYRLPDLVEQRIAYGDLTWNFRDRESNYLALRRSALSLDAGYSFVTTFAKQAPFDAPLRAMATKRGLSQGNLADLYFAQAAEDDDRSNDCGNSLPKLLEAPIIEENWEASSLPGSGALVCNGYSDLAAALVGLRPARAWLTRLELNLPKYALSMDCVVEPHEIQDEVSSDLQALRSAGRPRGCEQPVYTSEFTPPPTRPGSVVLWLILGMAALGLGRQTWRLRA